MNRRGTLPEGESYAGGAPGALEMASQLERVSRREAVVNQPT